MLIHRRGAGTGGTPAGPAVYAGPGDIVSGAAFWWGLRAYSNAAIGGNCCDIIRASDSATQTFVTLADGSVDLASITIFLAATTGKISKLYDQTGNSTHLVQATDARRPAFSFSVIGSLPGITFAGGQDMVPPGGVTQAQPYTYSAVTRRTGNFTTYMAILTDQVGSEIHYNSAANQIGMYIGGPADVTAADSTFHAQQAVASGASSNLYVDGSSNPENLATTSINGTFNFGGQGASQPLTGNIQECGVWFSAFSLGQMSSMNTNQHTYWGF